MKKAAVVVLIALLLTGCSGQSKEMERTLKLRTKLLSSSCSFDADISADYGDKLHTFSLQCQADAQGNVSFTVLKPDSIASISGAVDGEDGKLTFGDVALHFPLLADQQVTPVSAPWLLLKTLRAGYITSAGAAKEYLRVSIDDSYADNALHTDIWLDSSDTPVKAEILYRERKILSLDVKNFRIE